MRIHVGRLDVAKRVRILAPVMLALGTAFTGAAASAQTYAPGYPVCLHVYGRVGYIDCRYTSIAQCQLSASGISAECEVNPYSANAGAAAQPLRHHRRVY